MSGLSGFVINNGVLFVPEGLQGIVIQNSLDSVLIKVINGMGRPVINCAITTIYNSSELTVFTDQFGDAIIQLNSIADLTLTKEKSFKSYSYDRDEQGSLITIVFQPPMLE